MPSCPQNGLYGQAQAGQQRRKNGAECCTLPWLRAAMMAERQSSRHSLRCPKRLSTWAKSAKMRQSRFSLASAKACGRWVGDGRRDRASGQGARRFRCRANFHARSIGRKPARGIVRRRAGWVAEVAVVTGDTFVELVFGAGSRGVGRRRYGLRSQGGKPQQAVEHPRKVVAELKSKKVRTAIERRFYRNEIAVRKNLTGR